MSKLAKGLSDIATTDTLSSNLKAAIRANHQVETQFGPPRFVKDTFNWGHKHPAENAESAEIAENQSSPEGNTEIRESRPNQDSSSEALSRVSPDSKFRALKRICERHPDMCQGEKMELNIFEAIEKTQSVAELNADIDDRYAEIMKYADTDETGEVKKTLLLETYKVMEDEGIITEQDKIQEARILGMDPAELVDLSVSAAQFQKTTELFAAMNPSDRTETGDQTETVALLPETDVPAADTQSFPVSLAAAIPLSVVLGLVVVRGSLMVKGKKDRSEGLSSDSEDGYSDAPAIETKSKKDRSEVPKAADHSADKQSLQWLYQLLAEMSFGQRLWARFMKPSI